METRYRKPTLLSLAVAGAMALSALLRPFLGCVWAHLVLPQRRFAHSLVYSFT